MSVENKTCKCSRCSATLNISYESGKLHDTLYTYGWVCDDKMLCDNCFASELTHATEDEDNFWRT